jgi:glycosyltransferase involved in cell wall biosynthesis
MKRRLVVITEIIAPYRIPVFNELAARDDIGLHVLFLSETDPSLRQWLVYKEEIRFSYEVLPSLRRRIGKYNLLLNRGLTRALRRAHPGAILCGGYNYLALWQTARWARKHGVPLLLWIESTSADQRRGNPIVEALKRRFLSYCQAFVVPGISSREYLRQFKIPDRRIFTAPNAMDLRLFAETSRRARQNPGAIRREFDLPDRYFLNVGRFIPNKGVSELLEAYANLEATIRSTVGLVLAGDGVLKEQLVKRAAQISPGTVRFPGFVQKDRLPELYTLADAFVFPTLSDPWGFVVNEAMACGLPVIATDVAGCVADLVQGGWNGCVVPAGDVPRLTSALSQLATNDELRQQMSERSVERIAGYSPAAWAAGVAEAVAAVSKQWSGGPR